MHRGKATRPFCVVVTAVVDDAILATPGEPPPPHAAASSEIGATTTTQARMSGRRQLSMFGSVRSSTGKAHHGNMNGSALTLRSC
jgi:hypothetical protein